MGSLPKLGIRKVYMSSMYVYIYIYLYMYYFVTVYTLYAYYIGKVGIH